MAIWNIYFENETQKRELIEIRSCVSDDDYDPDSGYYTHIHVDVNIGNLCRFVADASKKDGFDLEEFVSDLDRLTDYDNNGYSGKIDDIKNYQMRYEMASELYDKMILPLLSGAISTFSTKWGLSFVFSSNRSY